MQATARFLDSVGLNSTDGNPYTGQIGVLRAAEAVDAVGSAARSGSSDSAVDAAGHLLCSVTQLGGLLYTTMLVVVALVILGFASVANYLFRFLYDLINAMRVVSEIERAGATEAARCGDFPSAGIGAAAATEGGGAFSTAFAVMRATFRGERRRARRYATVAQQSEDEEAEARRPVLHTDLP